MAIHINKVQILTDVYESVKFQIVLDRFINSLSLSDTDIEVLSIFYVHGVTDKAIQIIEDKKIYKNSQSISNTLTKLTKMGIIIKVDGQKKITDKLDVKVSDKILITLKIGNK